MEHDLRRSSRDEVDGAGLAQVELVERQLIGAVSARGRQVRQRSGRQVVDDVDGVTLGPQPVDERAADEPGAAGDQRLHGATRGTRAPRRSAPAATTSPSPITVMWSSTAPSPICAPSPTIESHTRAFALMLAPGKMTERTISALSAICTSRPNTDVRTDAVGATVALEATAVTDSPNGPVLRPSSRSSWAWR